MRSLKKRGPHVLNDLNDLLKLLTVITPHIVSDIGIVCCNRQTCYANTIRQTNALTVCHKTAAADRVAVGPTWLWRQVIIIVPRTVDVHRTSCME